jgi:hypothetical protein
MNLMNRMLLAAGLLVGALCACESIESDPRTTSLVERHINARGGSAAIRSIKAIKLNLDLVEPKFALQAEYFANRSNCMRIDIFMQGKYLQSEGVSSEGGWAVAAGDESFSPQPEGGTETLRHGIESPIRIFGLDEFRGIGNKIAYRGQDLIGSNYYDHVDVTYSDGYTAELYLDLDTHLISRIRERKPMHLAVDPTKITIETQFSDYRQVSGVMFPFFSREVNWRTGEDLGHTTVKSIVVNSADALALCSRPPLRR